MITSTPFTTLQEAQRRHRDEEDVLLGEAVTTMYEGATRLIELLTRYRTTHATCIAGSVRCSICYAVDEELAAIERGQSVDDKERRT